MKKRIIGIILVGTLAFSMLAGCGSNKSEAPANDVETENVATNETADDKNDKVSDKADGKAGEKQQITIMIDQAFRVDDLGKYLNEKYPDVNFDIVLGRSGVSYLKKYAENDSLPDIMISGSTWGRAGADLYPYLYDLSATDIASEFYTVYLDNYTTNDGKVYWLPGCAAIEGIMANRTLFDENGVDLPTDYASFVDACNKFTELGIRPYASDYKYDYTDGYLLQSLSIPLLQSADGKDWRLSYEEGATDILDEKIGLQMFEKLDSFFELTGVTEEDATRGYGATFGDFTEGKIAMIRQSTNNGTYYEAGLTDLVILPYFGETENDNWYFTTPSYAVAMSGELKGSDNEMLCLDIVRLLFSQECMDFFAEEVQAFTAYNKGITFKVQEQFENIIPYVESNHMYTYLSQDNFQAASKVAVQKMIAEGASPEEALKAFNEAVVQTDEDKETIASIDNGYSRMWTDNGNEAMSAVVNTLAKISDADIFLSPFIISTSSVYAGDYNATELGNLLFGGGLNFYKKELTGAEIKKIVATTVEGAGVSYDPISLSTLPGVSGCTMVISDNGNGSYKLDDLLIDGESISDDKAYKFVFADTTATILQAAMQWNPDEHDGKDIAVCENAEDFDFDSYNGFVFPEGHIGDQWNAYFTDGGKIENPTTYIQVK